MAKLTFILLLFPVFIFAQETQHIETDRPDQTETPAIVPKGMFQMENGFSYEKINEDSEAVVTPSSLIKFGVNDHFELRLILEFVSVKESGQKNSGLNPVLVGFKSRLAEEKGIIPETSFIAHLSIPDLASKDFKTTYYAPEFRFTMQHTLTDKVSLGYNLGAEWDGETPEPTFIYTLTTGISLSQKAGCYVELYGFAPQKDKADHRWDAGFTYLLSNDMMVDVSGGTAITENAPDYYAALGFSFRL
ncbi:transporter [Flavobacterium pallidum]|uniref:Transporter n=1 Tax=Flavobacterium pallidum TaxID=2172098 RepID=A0A2S1SF73_9FLAO|nr:transporter [Flavobacterium pallidum]AWI25022.1 transporter [Flavobacterium pallidum]